MDFLKLWIKVRRYIIKVFMLKWTEVYVYLIIKREVCNSNIS